MGKTIAKIALIAGVIALNFLPGVGQAITTALAATFAGTSLAVASFGLLIADLALVSFAVGQVGSLLTPKIPPAQLGRLNLTFDPNAYRKMWLGSTAGATDILYQESSGTDQEYVDYIIGIAAHRATSIDTIYTEDKVLWTAAGGVQGVYVGFCWIDVRLEGTAANAITINSGSVWNSSCRLTGCCYFHMRIKRTAIKKTESPFSGGLPSRMSVVGKGMPMYDPRRDSTRGGSGPMRANDQSTWAFTDGSVELGQNHALQALTAGIIGWRIGGVVSVGGGMPLGRVDFGDFITAANICDEAVALALGGTQRRYEGSGLFSDEEEGTSVLTTLCAHMDAELRDVNGKIGIRIAVNDLAGSLPAFTADDVLGDFEWNGFASLTDSPNVVRGRYTDASTASLYQLAPYSKVSVTSIDGVDRPENLDLALCQDAERAQRLATRLLLRIQYQATFVADFGTRAWALRPGDPMVQTFPASGLANQKFRVVSQTLKVVLDDDGARAFCRMTLRAEDPAIYTYTPGVVALPPAAIPAVSYNPLNNPLAVRNGADIGIDNDATYANNLQVNSLLTNDADGFNLTTGWMQRAAGTNGPPTHWVLATPAAASGAGQVIFPLSKVTGGSKVFVRIFVMRTAALGALTLTANVYNALTGGGIGPLPNGIIGVVPAAAGVWQAFDLAGVVYTDGGFIGLTIDGMTGNAGRVEVAAALISYSSPGADATAANQIIVTLPPEQVYAADYLSNLTEPLTPASIKVARGATSIKLDDATAFAIAPSSNISATIDSTNGSGTKGDITPTAFTGLGGFIDVTVTVAGAAQPVQRLVFTKQLAAAPSGGGSGGGGGTGKVATDAALGALTSTSYVRVSRTMTVVLASGESLYGTGPIDYYPDGTTSAFRTVTFMWRYAVSGSGSFTDFAGSGVAGTSSRSGRYAAGEYFDPEPGHADVTQTKSGLSAATYDVELWAKINTSGRTIYFDGTARVEAMV